MHRDQVLALLDEPVGDPAVFHALLTEVPGEVWRDVQARALTRALLRALGTPYHRERVDLTPEQISRDPFEAALAFPPLRKQDYWDHGARMRLSDVPVDLTFATSGTEGGIATEQPWDRWTFERSFGESSALALVSSGARQGDRVLLGTPLHGALGMAFGYACRALDLVSHADAYAFSDPEVFARETLPFVCGGVNVVVAAPGSVVMLVHRLRDAGIDPRALGVRAIVSGIGTFLADQHVDFFVRAFQPEVIHEQGGKNEILHAPGGRRYHRVSPQAISRPGFLHVLPWAAYVVAVDAAKLAAGVCLPVGHEREGVLLMTRLSAGRDGCGAYVSDAGDFGMTLGYGGVDSPRSACGNTMPAFRFMGRTGRTVENKIGETLFTEELVRALSLSSRAVGLDASVAVLLRIQAVLVHDADPCAADTLFWIIGAPRDLYASHRDAIDAAASTWPRFWPKHGLYTGPLAGVMRFGGDVVVEIAALPHAGRDKPQYPLAVKYAAAPGEAPIAVLGHHLRQMGAEVLRRNQG